MDYRQLPPNGRRAKPCRRGERARLHPPPKSRAAHSDHLADVPFSQCRSSTTWNHGPRNRCSASGAGLHSTLTSLSGDLASGGAFRPRLPLRFSLSSPVWVSSELPKRDRCRSDTGAAAMMGREALCILTSHLIQRGFSPSPLTTECPLHPFTSLSKGLTAAVARCPRSCRSPPRCNVGAPLPCLSRRRSREVARLPRVLNAFKLTNCIESYLFLLVPRDTLCCLTLRPGIAVCRIHSYRRGSALPAFRRRNITMMLVLMPAEQSAGDLTGQGSLHAALCSFLPSRSGLYACNLCCIIPPLPRVKC